MINCNLSPKGVCDLCCGAGSILLSFREGGDC